MWVKAYRERGEEALKVKKPALHPNLKKPADERAKAVLATHDAQPHAGSRRIRDVMRRFLGIGASETTVRRVLRAKGVKTQASPRRVRRKQEVQHFERAEPNQLWQSDLFTFLLRRHERIYVAAFLDDHSRYLVSLAMAHHQRSVLVLEALSRGIADYGAPREILTAQGRQYTAWRGSTEFEAELKRHGIQHVKSRPHHPQTCGKIERFWKTLWEELLSRTVFADFEDCQRRVALYIQHYNFQRPHQGLEGLTPADRFFRAASQVRASIEAQVTENALRLAQRQPLRKPFYLAGQLGDRALAISASGAALSVRVGDEHTTIPFVKESDDEDHARASRWLAGRNSEEAATPPSHLAQPAPVADAAGRATGDRAAAHLDDPRGALRTEVGAGGDRAGTGVARVVLPTGGSGLAGDAQSLESADRGGDERASRVDAGSRAGAHFKRTGEVPDAAQKECGAAVASPDQVELGAGDDRTAGPAAQSAIDTDDAWRRLALIWERKLCGAEAASDQEVSNERRTAEGTEFYLHADARGAAGAGAKAGVDPGSALGNEDSRASGAGSEPVAQSLPVVAQPIVGLDGAGPHTAGAGQETPAAGAEGARAASEEARAREQSSQEARGGDR
jgi:transposase InsO family protein